MVHSRTIRRPIRLLASAVMGLAFLLAGLPSGQDVVAAPADRLPDLAMAYPTDLRIEKRTGSRRLRFTTMIVNLGAGPFETGSSRLAGQPVMGVNQRIYNTAGTFRKVDTTATARYAGDGHDHWHVQDIAHYELYKINDTSTALRRDAKVGFCFFDTNAYRLSLPRAPKTRKYTAAGCGKKSSLFVKNGISVGWGDKYGWSLSRQWINIRNLPSGQYYLKVTVDPLRQFHELSRRNNCRWQRIQLSATSSVVKILASGSSCILPSPTT